MKIISLGIFCTKVNRDENFPDYGAYITASFNACILLYLTIQKSNCLFFILLVAYAISASMFVILEF